MRPLWNDAAPSGLDDEFEDDDFCGLNNPAHAGQTPVSIRQEWFTAYERIGRWEYSDYDDYRYVATYADGGTETFDRIRNDWLPLVVKPRNAVSEHNERAA